MLLDVVTFALQALTDGAVTVEMGTGTGLIGTGSGVTNGIDAVAGMEGINTEFGLVVGRHVTLVGLLVLDVNVCGGACVVG